MEFSIYIVGHRRENGRRTISTMLLAEVGYLAGCQAGIGVGAEVGNNLVDWVCKGVLHDRL